MTTEIKEQVEQMEELIGAAMDICLSAQPRRKDETDAERWQTLSRTVAELAYAVDSVSDTIGERQTKPEPHYASDRDYFARRLELREIGLKFHRFFSSSCVRLVGTAVSMPKPGKGDRKDANVYDILIVPDGSDTWRAKACCNGRAFFTMRAASKCALEKLSLAALKDWLYHKYVRTRRNLAARPAPLSPEAELAATVARQQEGGAE